MKKIILISTLVFLTACGSSQVQEVQYLEPDLTAAKLAELEEQAQIKLSNVTGESVVSDENEEQVEEGEVQTEEELEEAETEELAQETSSESSLSITNIEDGEEITASADSSVVFEGVAADSVTEIEVIAEGEGYTDQYVLNSFFAGKSSFTYRARQDWLNLAPGENTYTFRATLEDGTTEDLTVTINFIVQ